MWAAQNVRGRAGERLRRASGQNSSKRPRPRRAWFMTEKGVRSAADQWGRGPSGVRARGHVHVNTYCTTCIVIAVIMYTSVRPRVYFLVNSNGVASGSGRLCVHCCAAKRAQRRSCGSSPPSVVSRVQQPGSRRIRFVFLIQFTRGATEIPT